MRLFRSAFTFEIMLVSLFIAPQMVLMEVSPYAASAQTKSAEVFPVKSWSHASAQLEAPWSKEKTSCCPRLRRLDSQFGRYDRPGWGRHRRVGRHR
jgi:hypothetical protein